MLNKARVENRPLPRRIMLYGTHGIGKTTFASGAPEPFLGDIEGGGEDTEFSARISPLDGLESFDDVMQLIEDLLNDDHPFKTLAIDTLDWLEQWIWDKVCQEHNVKSIEEIGYGKGYQFAISHWREFLSGLDALRINRDMTILLLAHCQVRRFDSPESEAYDRYEPKLHKHASAVIQDWCDEVLFATYKTYTKSEDLGFNKTRKLGIGTGERVLRCTERPSHLAKNRLGLPDELPLDWDEFHAYVSGPSVAADAS